MSSPDSKEIDNVRCLKCGKILYCSRYDTSALLEHLHLDHPEVDIVDTDTKQKRTIDAEMTRSSTTQQQNLQINTCASDSKTRDEIEDCTFSDEFCNINKCRPNIKGQHVSYENTEDEDRVRERPKHQQSLQDTDVKYNGVIAEILEKYPEIKECEFSPHNPNAQVAYTRRYRLNSPSSKSMAALKQPFQRSLYHNSIERWRPVNGGIFCPKCGCNKKPLIKTKSKRYTYNHWGAYCILSCWPLCFIPWILPAQNNEYLHCANCKTFLGLYDRSTNCIQPNRLYLSMDYQQQNSEKAKRTQDFIRNSKLLENESTAQISVVEGTKSKHLPSIIVNGKELTPETVARIQKFKRLSPLVGLDIDALTNSTDSLNSTKRSDTRAPSVVKENKQTV